MTPINARIELSAARIIGGWVALVYVGNAVTKKINLCAFGRNPSDVLDRAMDYARRQTDRINVVKL